MVLTRLLITSGIPVVFFYIGCYNYEQNLLIRYKQSEFASQLIDRLPSDSLKASQVIIRKPAIYNDGAWIKNFELQSVEHKGGYSKEDSDAITLLSTFRLDATPEAVREEKFYVMNSADSLFSYTPITNDAKTKHTETVMYAKTNIPGILLKLTSTGLNYNFPSLLHCRGTPFWLLLFAALVLFFLLLRTIIKKLFAIKIPDLSRFQQLDNAIVLDDDLNNLLFVLGPPGAKKKDYIFEHLVKQANELRPDDTKLKYEKGKPWDNNVFIADLFNIPDSKDNQEEMSDWQRYRKQALDEKNKMVIVNHFEYNLEDQFTNRIKLNFLESLMMREEPKIIIISTIHPMAFLDSIFFEGKKKRGDSEKHHSSISREDLERWNVLLGHFRIVLLPIESLAESEPLVITADEIELNSEQDDKDATSYSWTILSGPVNAAHAVKFKPPDKASTRVTNLVEGVYEFQVKVTLTNSEVIIEKKKVAVHGLTYGETQRAAFVNKMREKAIAIAQYNYEHEKDFDPDELAFKLQFTSQYHYMYIWQSLTKEEKFLLYDLAEDNLVNSFDAHNLSMLIGKGIIYRDKDDTLKIFNKGFRNFILTAIGNSEAMKIKDQIRETGNWGKWRTPLIIILISILLFLIISQEGAYSKLITYVGALGAGIPVFLRLISLFDRSSQKGS